MFKRILSAFIGSLVAIWVSSGLLFLIVISMVTALVASDDSDELKDHSVLRISLKGAIEEKLQNVDFKDMVLDGGSAPQYLDEILESVNLAADDSKIDGIFLDCAGADMGVASRQELLNALQVFKKSGKWVLAYGDNYSQGDYYVASMADTVSVNPVGSIDIRGLASQIPFYKDALDKLGITVQVIKVGQFKSAVEPYILTEPSEPSERQTRVFLDAIWKNVKTAIAQNRKVTPEQVNAWADSMVMTLPADKLKEMRVVDEVCYRRTVDDRLRRLTKLESDDDIRYIGPADYLASDPESRVKKIREKKYDKVNKDDKFAILYASGEISDDGESGIVGESMVKQINDLANDDDIKGLVMRVNSPGGSAFASEQIWEALENFKKTGKPFYVSMGDYAASGGYYISCGADSIFCDPNTLTGSIGIFGLIPCVKGLADKVGVNIATIETNPNADLGSLLVPMSESQKNAMQAYVERGYELFTNRVAEGRNIPIAKVLEIAEGRVWDGVTAKSIGLVDIMGGVETAVNAMAHRLNMSPDNYETYPKANLTALEQLILDGTGNATASVNKAVEKANPVAPLLKSRAAKDVQDKVEFIRNTSEKGTVQARMESVLIY